MTNGKILTVVVALTLFFLVVGFVRNFFQFPEDKVKYNLLYVRVEGSHDKSLSFNLSLILFPQAAHKNLNLSLNVLLPLRKCDSPK